MIAISQASLKFRRRMWPLVGLYAVAFLATESARIAMPTLPQALMLALAIAVALPIAGLIWAMLRYADEEPDEFLRAKHVHAMMIGFGATLMVCTVWGYLTRFTGLMPLPLEYVIIVFGLAHGAAGFFVERRYR